MKGIISNFYFGRAITGKVTLLAFMVFSCCFIFGCGNDSVKEEEAIPSVKVFTVGKKSEGQLRKISGKVYSGEKSNLSFGISGKVKEIIVSEGETVAKGQLLARIDDEPFRIRVKNARAQLNNARTRLEESRSTYNRNEKLFKKQAVSKKEFDDAVFNLSTAEESLKAAQAGLNQAELDLSHTKLTAPFAGKVDNVIADPFQETGAGETILSIKSDKSLEVKIRVPETLIRYLDFGQAVKVTFPTMPDTAASGTISAIAAEAEEGNSFPVTIDLINQDSDLRPGMSASVLFNFDKYLEGKTAYMIPISAVAVDTALLNRDEYPHEETPRGKEAPVFILDKKEGIIHERKVIIGDVRGNELEVFEGLSEGELVVSAGVSFLRDGMKARIWVPENDKEK